MMLMRASGQEEDFRDSQDLDDDWLISQFLFPKPVLLNLCAELGPIKSIWVFSKNSRTNNWKYFVSIVGTNSKVKEAQILPDVTLSFAVI